MIRKPLPYPPQMRKAAHLLSSPHFNPMADIVSDLKAISQEVAAACACCQQLLDKHDACARQKAAAACARVFDAIARARQEAACH
jgi:hypothetical protein